MERLTDALLAPGEELRAEARVVLAVDRAAPGRPGRRRTTRRRLGERVLLVTDRRLLFLAVDVRGRRRDVVDRELARDAVGVKGVAGGIAPAIVLASRQSSEDDLVVTFPMLGRRGFAPVCRALGIGPET